MKKKCRHCGWAQETRGGGGGDNRAV